MYLYKVGIQSSILVNQSVLISEASYKRGSTVFDQAMARSFLPD